MHRPLLLIVLPLFFLGCSIKRSASTVVGHVAWDGQVILERESDVELARDATPSLILSFAVLAQGNPKDPIVAALLAKAYGQYAYGFYEEDLLRFRPLSRDHQQSYERASRFYALGMEAGLVALGNAESAFDFERKLKRFGKKDIPLLFWTAFCWGGWLNLHRDDPKALIGFPKVAALMDRVVELDPKFYFGVAEGFRAVLDASRPPMLGGNPSRAKARFEKALAIHPSYFMTKVLYAQYYAVQIQDRHLFDQLLREVIASDVTALPEQRLANEIAKRRAALLLKKGEQWF